jgi:hypothetical protein
MSNRRSVEGEQRVEGSVLDELGLDRQAALELKLKAKSPLLAKDARNGAPGIYPRNPRMYPFDLLAAESP